MNELLVIGNPSKRRRKRKASRARRRSSVARRRSRVVARRRKTTFRVRARRNPISARGITGQILPTVKNGALGAVGGLANDVLYGFAASRLSFLPQGGMARNAAKVLSAVLVGALGNMALRGKGAALASGAATVAIHGALKEQLATMPFFASLPLGEYITDQSGVSGYDAAMPVDGYDEAMGEADEGMGEYFDA